MKTKLFLAMAIIAIIAIGIIACNNDYDSEIISRNGKFITGEPIIQNEGAALFIYFACPFIIGFLIILLIDYIFFEKEMEIKLGFIGQLFFRISITTILLIVSYFSFFNKLIFIIYLIAISAILLILVEILLGKIIGKSITEKAGLILGIVLIIMGITLFLGIPIIVFSNRKNSNSPEASA